MVVSSPQYGENTASFASFFFAEFVVKVFCYLFLWKFKKKVSTIFYDTAFLINEDRGNGTGGMCVSGIMYGEGLCV